MKATALKLAIAAGLTAGVHHGRLGTYHEGWPGSPMEAETIACTSWHIVPQRFPHRSVVSSDPGLGASVALLVGRTSP